MCPGDNNYVKLFELVFILRWIIAGRNCIMLKQIRSMVCINMLDKCCMYVFSEKKCTSHTQLVLQQIDICNAKDPFAHTFNSSGNLE